MTNFISLSIKTNNNKCYLNLNHIISVLPYYDDGTQVCLVSGQYFYVKETVDEIMDLINNKTYNTNIRK